MLVKGNVQNISACKELTKSYNVVTCPILKFAKGVASNTSFEANLPASAALLQSGTYVHGTSNLFLCSFIVLPMTSHVDCPLCLKKCKTTVPILILPIES